MNVTGRVLRGINNIYTVKIEEMLLECRIKGKILKNAADEYNPLAAGDIVDVETEGSDSGKGLIVRRLERKSGYSRWNKKRNAPQIIAANFDMLVIVASVDNPPFRPRFIDRILAMADQNIETVIVLNKVDKVPSEETILRLNNYRDIGYGIMMTSVTEGSGIEKLRKKLEGKTAVFSGQSGVGKSSLLNVLFPGLDLKVGEVSVKYNRGKHTTNYAQLIFSGNTGIIDTPGIREIEVFGIAPNDLQFRFPEFIPIIGKCRYPSCLHVDEPTCAIKDAVEKEIVHKDRYESYIRILNNISEKPAYR